MKRIKNIIMLAVGSCLAVFQAVAGVVDMPDIVESPELEKKTMVRDLDIPVVKKRNIDPMAGPRLAVAEFRIQGLVEYPELGISREALTQIVEEIRVDLMNESEYLPSGYTTGELGEISSLLVDIEGETIDRHVTPSEVQRLVWLVRDQRAKRGILLSQIESVADRITQFYRERGFILAKAYIPKQQVRDGVVNLTLLIGVLGEVTIHGNELYSDDQLASVFNEMLTKPVTSDAIEENLYLINDFPGVIVDGYFEPGYQVGDTRLNVNVKKEDRYNTNIRLDNHGTDQTGRYRLYGEIQANNMLGHADLLKLSVLSASKPNNTQYWRLNYRMNLFSPRFNLGAGISKNQFIVDQSTALTNINLSGIVNVRDIEATYIIKKSRVKNYSMGLAYERIESDLQVGDTPDIGRRLDQELESKSLQFNFDVLQEAAKVLHQGDIKLTSGAYLFGVSLGQDSSYTFMSASYTALKFLQLPLLGSETRLIFRTNAQYSGINLSSIVRFSTAGSTRVRAFPSNLYSADDAIYAGVDWIFYSPSFLNFNIFDNVNVRDLVKPMLFADYAWGKQYSLVENESDVSGSLSDIGVGLQFTHGVKFRGDLQVAIPTKNKFSKEDVVPDKNDIRIIFEVQYGF